MLNVYDQYTIVNKKSDRCIHFYIIEKLNYQKFDNNKMPKYITVHGKCQKCGKSMIIEEYVRVDDETQTEMEEQA